MPKLQKRRRLKKAADEQPDDAPAEAAATGRCRVRLTRRQSQLPQDAAADAG